MSVRVALCGCRKTVAGGAFYNVSRTVGRRARVT